MRTHVKLFVVLSLFCLDTTQAQFKTFIKKPVPEIIAKYYDGEIVVEDPYESTKLDYYYFEEQGTNEWAHTKGDWYLKYKNMFDFRCKEPFWGASPKYSKNDYIKSGYKFRLVDNQTTEDSLLFLLSRYLFNNKDTLKFWHLPPNSDGSITEKIIKRLGTEHFKIIIIVFDSRIYNEFIEVAEAEQINDNMVYMEVIKYPAKADVFSYNFEIENWEYVESVTVSGDHELELYILNKFEPRYLKMCE
jgi:hypothetical protein